MSLIAGRGCRWPPRRDSVSPCAPLSGGRDTHDGHENSPILVFFSNLLGVGYDEITVEVDSTTGPMAAFTYVADADAIMSDLKPYIWYKEFVVAGAAEHDLSAEYVDTIRAIEAVHDPDEARRVSNEQILYPERSGRMRVR